MVYMRVPNIFIETSQHLASFAKYLIELCCSDPAITGEKTPEVDMREAIRMTLPGIYALESARAGGRLTAIEYPWG